MFLLLRTGVSPLRSFFPVLRFPHSRNLSFLKNLQNIAPQPQLIDKNKYLLIYEFPSIVAVGKFMKTKYTFPGCSAICLSICYYAGVDNAVILPCIYITVLQFAITVSASRFLRNTIGKVYVNKGSEVTEVLVSCVNSFGARIDRCHAPKELVPVTFSSKSEEMLGFLKIVVPETNITYKMNIPSAKFHDMSVCKKLFGNIIIKQKEGTTEKTVETRKRIE